MNLGLVRFVSTTSKFLKNYYEVLEVSPQATQAQIKAAYYKLSLIHHPDRNQGDPAKFQEITAAYEVLGNYNSRKLYDRGVTTIYEDSSEQSSRPFKEKHRVPTPSGRTVVYDFDEWTRAHYGETFARRNAAKARYNDMCQTNEVVHDNSKIQNIIYSFFILFAFIVFLSQYQDNLDIPKNKTDKENPSRPKQ